MCPETSQDLYGHFLPDTLSQEILGLKLTWNESPPGRTAQLLSVNLFAVHPAKSNFRLNQNLKRGYGEFNNVLFFCKIYNAPAALNGSISPNLLPLSC